MEKEADGMVLRPSVPATSWMHLIHFESPRHLESQHASAQDLVNQYVYFLNSWAIRYSENKCSFPSFWTRKHAGCSLLHCEFYLFLCCQAKTCPPSYIHGLLFWLLFQIVSLNCPGKPWTWDLLLHSPYQLGLQAYTAWGLSMLANSVCLRLTGKSLCLPSEWWTSSGSDVGSSLRMARASSLYLGFLKYSLHLLFVW